MERMSGIELAEPERGPARSASDVLLATPLLGQLLPGLGAPPAPSADALRAALAATPDDACAACLPEAPPSESAVLS